GDGDNITTPDYDDRRVSFSGDTSQVSGKLKRIPNLPVITVSSSQASLQVLPANAPPTRPVVELKPDDWTRWNAYGIGLFLQGNLIGDRPECAQVTELYAKH